MVSYVSCWMEKSKRRGKKDAETAEIGWPRVGCAVARFLDISMVDTILGAEKRLVQKVAIHLCHGHSGAKLREIGARFGISASAVSQESRRLLGRMAEDESLRERVEEVRKKLGVVNV